MTYELDDEEKREFSPAYMRQWAERELKDIGKAAELRAREVNAIVAAYSAGELTAQQAFDQQQQYSERWHGDPLPGATAEHGASDEQILADMDSWRAESDTRRKKLASGQGQKQYR